MVPLGWSIIAASVTRWISSQNLRRWRELETCRQAKLMMPEPTVKKAKKVLSYTRGTLSWLTALVTGHGNFMYHLKKMRLVEDDTCRLCLEEVETATHIVCECPALSRRRLAIMGNQIIGEDMMGRLELNKLLAVTVGVVMRTETENFSTRNTRQ